MASPLNGNKRVLVAEDDKITSELIISILTHGGYLVEVVENGLDCLKKAKEYKAKLILLDIMLPGMHGIDVLKALKKDQDTKDIGVIMCSAKNYKPDQTSSLLSGAYCFLPKPFDPRELLSTVNKFFANGTHKHMDLAPTAPINSITPRYLPKLPENQAYLKFWGTRGSVPVSGDSFVRHGGNTSCMEFSYGNDILIFDAGTGIRELGTKLLQGKPKKVHIFISHSHWDHIQGFPFFTPAYKLGFEIHIYGVAGFGKDLKSIFKGQLDRDYFPVQLEDMQAKIEFHHVKDEPIKINDISITWEYTQHPGAAVCFKISCAGKTIVYMSDNEVFKGYFGAPQNLSWENEHVSPYHRLIGFIQNVDLLVAEAQYTNEEYIEKIGWGHSSTSNACLLAKFANVKKWLITHHDPIHKDDFLEDKLALTKQILEELACPIEVSNAYDNQFFRLESAVGLKANI